MTTWLNRVIGRYKEVKVQTEEEIMKEKTVYTMTESDKLREVRLKHQALSQDLEFERKRQSILEQQATQQSSLQRHYMSQSSPGLVSIPAGMATNIPGQGYTTFGTSNMPWQSTRQDPNTMTDADKAQFIANLLMREGLTKVSGRVSHLVNGILLGRQITSTPEKKQPKKKLDL